MPPPHRCGRIWVIIESTIGALIGVRAHWQHIPRTGDVEVVPG
jgi:hypothetical protein